MMVQLIDEIALKFYGVQRRNPMQGMLGDIFKVHPVRIWTWVHHDFETMEKSLCMHGCKNFHVHYLLNILADGWLVSIIGPYCHYVFVLSTNYIYFILPISKCNNSYEFKLIFILKFADYGRWLVDGGNLILLCVVLWELSGRYPE